MTGVMHALARFMTCNLTCPGKSGAATSAAAAADLLTDGLGTTADKSGPCGR